MTAPEFRRCPIRGHFTIFAPGRGNRPLVTGWPQLKQSDTEGHAVGKQNDPFLAGNEDQTAVELLTIPGDAAWSVRVVENLYPAFAADADASPQSHLLLHNQPARGHHEVIVECPQFEAELANLPPSQLAAVLSAWQQRLITIEKERCFDYAFIFKNSGARAGTSLPHTHSQLIATTLTPESIRREHATAREYFEQTGTPVLHEVIAAERAESRVVLDESGFVAFCPYASRFAYETIITPTTDVSFLDLESAAITNLAGVLHGLLNAFIAEQPAAAYNLLLHATPFSAASKPWFRWRLEIAPRVAQLAGLELGTGWYVNSVMPADAASRLRQRLTG